VDAVARGLGMQISGVAMLFRFVGDVMVRSVSLLGIGACGDVSVDDCKIPILAAG